MTDPTCLFCRILRGEIPATILDETEHALAFADIDAKAPLHALVIPKRHVASLADADDPALVGELAMLAAGVAGEAGFGESGYRLVVNTGPDAGQSVPHLHLHVLAGRPLDWPPG